MNGLDRKNSLFREVCREKKLYANRYCNDKNTNRCNDCLLFDFIAKFGVYGNLVKIRIKENGLSLVWFDAI